RAARRHRYSQHYLGADANPYKSRRRRYRTTDCDPARSCGENRASWPWHRRRRGSRTPPSCANRHAERGLSDICLGLCANNRMKTADQTEGRMAAKSSKSPAPADHHRGQSRLARVFTKKPRSGFDISHGATCSVDVSHLLKKIIRVRDNDVVSSGSLDVLDHAAHLAARRVA